MGKYYVVGTTTDELWKGNTVTIVSQDVKLGPYDTYDRAACVRAKLEVERWISGAHVYYDLQIVTGAAK